MQRTNFHSSSLIGTLADLAVLKIEEPDGDFAQKLGQWIDFAGAIALCAVHNASVSMASCSNSGVQSVAPVAIAQTFDRMRLALENSIKVSCSLNAGQGRLALPLPEADTPLQDASAYAPYRRFHLAHQRDMEASVRSMRAQVRDQIAKVSPRLKQLADFDAALDAILSERENKLLSTQALRLKTRFEQLLKAHQQALASAPQDDSPGLWMKPGAWLSRFCSELQTVLLAELDLRLQPTIGLIEALNNENKKNT
ncbi:MAG: DUF3348 domain-containing protein [Gammaproteobacteria bacterium]|nr:DUF3348 domain-containing protein [Gammaproteobacteria bacterium]MBU3999241.1 DUF3348 domain-containing protein [Gammaproteobacteria bacterium]MBU4018708.1 DUF3348 domain-containing protein [Gammaproteobacteria bacterium]MBU4079663.1 DUF3348 domain-containing protein [Gammaproteobacteria bacterium]MBU4112838.1 DUF3348 domain-containing protein [Gammaproteobacteria bacterium]